VENKREKKDKESIKARPTKTNNIDNMLGIASPTHSIETGVQKEEIEE
jgi:hypothetical protein